MIRNWETEAFVLLTAVHPLRPAATAALASPNVIRGSKHRRVEPAWSSVSTRESDMEVTSLSIQGVLFTVTESD